MSTPISLKEFISIFSRSFGTYKSRVLILAGLGFINGVLGGIGISAVIPLFSFVSGGTTSNEDTITRVTQYVFSIIGLRYTLANIVIFIIVMFVAKALSALGAAYLNYRITLRYQEETRVQLFKETLASNWPYLLSQKLGYIETVIMKNIEKSTLLLEQTSLALMTFMTVIAYTIVALNISTMITSLILIAAVVMFILLRSFPRKIEQYSIKLEALSRDIAHHINEAVLGMKMIKARGVEEAVALRTRPLIQGIKHESLKIRMSSAIPNSLLEPASIILVVGIFFFARNTPGFNIATLAAVIYVIKQIFNYLMQVQTYVLSIRELVPYTRIVLAYGDEARKHKENFSEVAASFAFRDVLEFRDVTFVYDHGKKILDSVSFKVKRGEMVGIIGQSGAGKTTLVDLFLRLFAPQHGSIFVDQVPSSDISEKEWRSHIGYISQDVFLLNGSIAENIRFYDESITDADMKEAAKLASIYDFVESLPEKWETQVGERGVMLSGGQRQRLGIAMALARKPEIVIFDEATSALDNESEAQVKKAMENMRGKVTMLVITHRISTVLDADKIITLGGGRVLEEGKPKDLLVRPDSYLSKMQHIANKS